MSGTESADEGARTVTVERDEVRVEKSLALEEFDTPAIVFRVVSGRDEAVYLRITDPLPEGIDPDDVGLHPEYDSEGWRRRGGNLQFEGRLGPDGRIETVYGLRVADVGEPNALLAEPRIDEFVEAGETDGSAADALGSDADATDEDATDEAAGGDEAAAEAHDGEIDLDLEDDTATADDSDAGADSDGDEDGESAPGTGAAADGSGAGAPTAPTAAPGDADTLAAALVAELERGAVDERTREALGEQLQPSLPTSAEHRIESVQTRVADLEAYTGALERILDRVGDDDDVVARIEEFRGQVGDLEGRLDELHADLEDTDARLRPLEGLEDDVPALRSDLEGEIATLRSDVEDDVATLQSDLETVREEVEAVRRETEELREELSKEVSAEVEELRAEVETLQEWRETLASTLAGAGRDDGG